MQPRELIDAADRSDIAEVPRALRRTRRGWQLQILTEMNLPKDERSKDNRPVKAVELGAVLRAIDNRAGETGWYFRQRKDLLGESQLDSLRKLDRALEVLKRRGWIDTRERRLPSGARLTEYRIIFQELCRTTALPLWVDNREPVARREDQLPAEGTACPPGEPVARHGDQLPAMGTSCPCGQTKKRSLDPLPAEAPHEAPTTTSTASLGWEEAVKVFHGRVGKQVCRELARELANDGRTPADFVAELETALETANLPENRARLNSPAGAAVFYVRNGFWPIPPQSSRVGPGQRWDGQGDWGDAVDGHVSIAEHQAKLEEGERTRREEEARRAAHVAAQAAADAAAKDLEQRYGPRLDAMTPADVESLLCGNVTDERRRLIMRLGVGPQSSYRQLALGLVRDAANTT